MEYQNRHYILLYYVTFYSRCCETMRDYNFCVDCDVINGKLSYCMLQHFELHHASWKRRRCIR